MDIWQLEFFGDDSTGYGTADEARRPRACRGPSGTHCDARQQERL